MFQIGSKRKDQTGVLARRKVCAQRAKARADARCIVARSTQAEARQAITKSPQQKCSGL
jgi:hypothetical protein